MLSQHNTGLLDRLYNLWHQDCCCNSKMGTEIDNSSTWEIVHKKMKQYMKSRKYMRNFVGSAQYWPTRKIVQFMAPRLLL